MSHKKRVSAVEKLLQEAYDEGLNEGLSLGISACERIKVWYTMNPKLKEPETPETLEEYAKQAMDDLRNRMKPDKALE